MRQIETYKGDNLIIVNNIGTCNIFLNKVGESIKMIEESINKDKICIINE